MILDWNRPDVQAALEQIPLRTRRAVQGVHYHRRSLRWVAQTFGLADTLEAHRLVERGMEQLRARLERTL